MKLSIAPLVLLAQLAAAAPQAQQDTGLTLDQVLGQHRETVVGCITTQDSTPYLYCTADEPLAGDSPRENASILCGRNGGCRDCEINGTTNRFGQSKRIGGRIAEFQCQFVKPREEQKLSEDGKPIWG